jgi:hypothetical protein
MDQARLNPAMYTKKSQSFPASNFAEVASHTTGSHTIENHIRGDLATKIADKEN